MFYKKILIKIIEPLLPYSSDELLSMATSLEMGNDIELERIQSVDLTDHDVVTKTYPPVFTPCNSCDKKTPHYFIRRDEQTGRKYYACNDCGKIIVR